MTDWHRIDDPENPPPAFAPVQSHDYVPDVMLMGDCAICGHVRDAYIHTRRDALPPPPVTP